MRAISRTKRIAVELVAAASILGCMWHAIARGEGWAGRANDTVVVKDDLGGVVQDYADKYDRIKQTGERVVLAGECTSACTLVLELPKNQVCAMPGAFLGFHSATDGPGGKVHRDWTVAMANEFYPPKVRRWFLALPVKKHNAPYYRSASSLGIRACRNHN